ncbi:MAG: hypothetical protein PHV61_02315 [Limnochordia bacterium]|nr:hypothetical protein [Limnochordia bacterium]
MANDRDKLNRPFQEKVSLNLSSSEEEIRHNLEIAASVPGFFKLVMIQATEDETKEIVVLQEMLYEPYHPEEPCPCGSESPFGTCCKTYGHRRPFVANPDGSLSLACAYKESWVWDSFEETRRVLKSLPNFLTVEDSDECCFFRYCPHGSGIGKELFGTVELRATSLTIETLSENRYHSLREAIEKAQSSPLPKGERSVKILSPEMEDEGLGGGGVPEETPLLEKYQVYRKRTMKIHSEAVHRILSSELFEAAKMLKMTAGQIITMDEEETPVLMDFALHEVQRHGKPIIDYYLKDTVAEDAIDQALHEALANTWVSFFRIEQVTSEGLILRDLMDDSRPQLQLIDIGLSSTAKKEYGIMVRIVPLPDFAITSGWMFGVTPDRVAAEQKRYEKILRSTARRRRTAAGIIHFRKISAPSHISYRS